MDSIAYNLPENVNKFYGDTKLAQDYIKKNVRHIKTLFAFFETKRINLYGKKIIDIGCGTGHCLQQIKTHYSNVVLTGTEFSDEAIKIASTVSDGIPIIKMDIARQALNDKFDIVLCQQVLEHIADSEAALRNLWTMTAPLGLLVITIPDGRLDSFAGHIHFWSKESFTILLQKLITTAERIEVGYMADGPRLYAILSKAEEAEGGVKS